MKTRFYVMDGKRKCCQYADKVRAGEHAAGIVGGSVKELPFEPQYSKAGSNKVLGVRHSTCSRQQADADGVKWYEPSR